MKYVVPGLLGICLSAGPILFGAAELFDAVYVYGIASLLALIWAGKLFFARTVFWKPSPMHWPVLGFLVYTSIQYFLSPYEYLSRLELFHVSLYGLVYFIAANNINRGRERTIVLSILLVLGTLEAMYGIWQGYTESEAVLQVTRPSGVTHRASGTYLSPNHLAGLLEMIIGFAIARLALYRLPERDSIEAQVLQKVMLAYAVVVMLVGILFTLSRAGWVSTIAGLLVFLVWGGLRSGSVWQRVAAGVGVLCVLGLLMMTFPRTKYYVQLTLSPDSSFVVKDASLNSRTILWSPTWKIFKDYPIFGTGAGTWQWVHQKYRDPKMQFDADYAHNDILQMASDYGLVGLLLAGATIGIFFWQAKRFTVEGATSEQRCFAVGAVLAVSILLVHSWFDFNLHIPANGLLFCAILGLLAGMEVPDGPFVPRPMNGVARYLLGCALVAVVGAWVYFVVPSARAVYYTQLGNAVKKELRWNEAIGYFNTAIELDPKYIRPRTKLAEIYVTLARFRGEDKKAERVQFLDEAIRLYETALALNRSRGDVMAKLAGAHELAGDFDKARHCYERAIQLDPNNAMIHTQFGVFLRRRGEDKQAMHSFEIAQKLNATRVSDLNLWELRQGITE